MIVETPCFQRGTETADRIDLTYEGIATPVLIFVVEFCVNFDRIDLTYEGIATFALQSPPSVPLFSTELT